MVRRLIALLIAALLLATVWLRSPPGPHNFAQSLSIAPLPDRSRNITLGPFVFAGGWRLTSPNETFGSYSALLPLPDGKLRAISDRATMLDFLPPDAGAGQPRMAGILMSPTDSGHDRDFESATRDPRSDRVWIAVEGRNSIIRTNLGNNLRKHRKIPELQAWRGNIGPEAMVRLRDGRFVILCECFAGSLDRRAHPGFVFDRDPVEDRARSQAFSFAGPAGFRPTDMAELPDGRLLILMRRLVWPMPPQFWAKLILVDPAGIEPGGTLRGIELAELTPPLPLDNYEGMAVVPGRRGKHVVWLISDDNKAVTQSTLLLKLEFAMADLPPKQKAPGSSGRP